MNRENASWTDGLRTAHDTLAMPKGALSHTWTGRPNEKVKVVFWQEIGTCTEPEHLCRVLRMTSWTLTRPMFTAH